MGWFETLDVVTEIMKRVEQQMWYPGTDGTPIALCREQGLPGIENMQLNELRALLSSQPDFACLKPEIQEEENAVATFYLALNVIQNACKSILQYCRKNCGQSITNLRANLHYAFSTQHQIVNHHTSFSDHTWKWIEAYTHEANGIAVYETLKALKKIHRHCNSYWKLYINDCYAHACDYIYIYMSVVSIRVSSIQLLLCI